MRATLIKPDKLTAYKLNNKTIHLNSGEEKKFGREGYKKLRSSAKQRGIEFRINDVEDLVSWWINTNDSCFWCGIDETTYSNLIDCVLNSKSKRQFTKKLKVLLYNHNNKYFTYDRRDSNSHYELKNLVKSCLFCNNAKGFLISEELFISIASFMVSDIMELVGFDATK